MMRNRVLKLVPVALTLLVAGILSAPAPPIPSRYSGEAQKLADPTYGPLPGMSNLYNSYWGEDRPFPGNITDPVFPTQYGPPAEDDYAWQNLLSAEWVIFEFYQQGIEAFSDEDFVKIGMPNTTRRRLMEIRNNEAGHLRIFQNNISPTSIKPGPCKYVFPLTDPLSYLAFLTVLEISSMVFLSGLVQQVKSKTSAAAMLAIAETETRHEVWALMDLWKVNPFGGPADTMFPYANQILDSTNNLIVPGSCPPENPEYPFPRQKLPALSAALDTKTLEPGYNIRLSFPDPTNQPVFKKGTQYYAVFFHSVFNISVPIETRNWPEEDVWTMIPAVIDTKGAIVALLADKPGAPTDDSVVAGPAVILEQPAELGVALLRASAQQG
ncbi:Stress response protein rds1p [Madurella fahalii]|uniref:Stress response protein rds1p n=1 Tax=Madurella fahalii TaxID=1157608 RepID=A0ABQ0GL36_9PEZI